ncbi:MAG: YgfZ/GcvT domain-containing protein [Rhodanobacteraceae bacterium]
MTSPNPNIDSVHAIRIEGVDAHRFAQAQFSGDVDALAPGRWQWNAWLTAQGRVAALMHLADPGDGTLLAVLRGGCAESVRSTLARYLLRMHATLTVESFTARSGDPEACGVAASDSGRIVLGYGTRSLRLEPVQDLPTDPAARACWRLEDIRQGWPSLPADDPRFLPPALGLEHLGAVSFNKGCFPGQEIAARLHYRGGCKSRLCLLHGSAPLSAGEIRHADGTASGWILDAVTVSERTEALAVLSGREAREIMTIGCTYAVAHEFGA